METKKVQKNNAPKSAISPRNSASLVKQPWITEKAYALSQTGQYVFLVDKDANKPEIKKAIKKLYKVDPVSVNMVTIKKKSGRFMRSQGSVSIQKRAIVTLKKGQKIDVMPS